MSERLNEDTLFGCPNSIILGDGIPEGNQITYRKGDIIVNVGEKRAKEPIYICIEAGAPGKWVYIQGCEILKDSPVLEEPSPIDTVVFNQNLAELIKEYSSLKIQDEPLDVDLSNTYTTIATIDNPEFAAAEKQIHLDGRPLTKTCKLSIGNGNFIMFDQYKDNGTSIELSIFTLAASLSGHISIKAEGFMWLDLNVRLENPTEVEEVRLYKGAKWQNEKYKVNKITKNEYELEILTPLDPAGWTPNLDGGTAWVLFDFMDAEGNNMFANGGQMVTKRIIDGEVVSSGTEELKQFQAEDGSKDFRGFAYLNVYNDHGYTLEYNLAFLDGSCRPQQLIIHVPANVVK